MAEQHDRVPKSHLHRFEARQTEPSSVQPVSNPTSGQTQGKPPCNRTSSRNHTNDQNENAVIISKERVDILRPGQASPSQAESSLSNLHSDLQGNLAFRQDESFFNDPSTNNPKATVKPDGGTGRGVQEESPVVTQSKAGDPNILNEDLARTRQPAEQLDPSQPEGNLSYQAENPPLNRASPDKSHNSASNSTETTNCKRKKKKDKAVSAVRATAQAAAEAVRPGQNQTLSVATTQPTNATPVSPLPDLSQTVHHHSLNPGALAGIFLALIILASIPISIAIVRRRRRKNQIKIMFEQGPEPTEISYAQASLNCKSGDISSGDIDELMNRIASVQAPKRNPDPKQYAP